MQETSAALIDQLVYIDNFINNSDTPNLDVDGQLSLDLAAFADESFVFADEDKPSKPDADDGANEDHPDADFAKNTDFHQLPGSSSKGENSWFLDIDVDPNTNYEDPHQHQLSSDHRVRPNGTRWPGSSLNESTKQAKRNRINLDKGGGDFGPHDELERNGNHQGEQHESEQPQQRPLLAGNIPDLSRLPKFPVPPGAKTSLQQAGLSQNQIDLLSALIAQHQTSIGNTSVSSQSNNGEGLHNGESLPYVTAPVLASHAPPTHVRQNSYYGDSESVATTTPSARTTTQISGESPGSTYSSGYSSGGTSSLSTPLISTRGSFANEGQSSELDKRRRNTAASARFRIKKKIKEKEMETKILQLNDMIESFEIKINELEMENRLLKNLIIEKGNRNSDQELQLLKERAKFQGKKGK